MGNHDRTDEEIKAHVQSTVERSLHANTQIKPLPIVPTINIVVGHLLDAIEQLANPDWPDKDGARKACVIARTLLSQM